jgi:hypothetical protein
MSTSQKMGANTLSGIARGCLYARCQGPCGLSESRPHAQGRGQVLHVCWLLPRSPS